MLVNIRSGKPNNGFSLNLILLKLQTFSTFLFVLTH